MAQFNLGGCYVVGEGVERDKAEAVKWLSKAAENADTREKAKAALKRIEEEDSLIDNAESPTGETEYEAGLKFYREKRYESAFKLFEKGTDRGHAGAQTYLALCYVYGRGVAKDSIKAFELFRKAAAQGNAEAMFNLGVCYQDGVGIKRTEPKLLTGTGKQRMWAIRMRSSISATVIGRETASKRTRTKLSNGSEKPPNKAMLLQ